jgi:hypothetical protein
MPNKKKVEDAFVDVVMGRYRVEKCHVRIDVKENGDVATDISGRGVDIIAAMYLLARTDLNFKRQLKKVIFLLETKEQVDGMKDFEFKGFIDGDAL